MNDSVGQGALSELASLRATSVQIKADGCLYEGMLLLVGEGQRLQDLLNDPKPFLTLSNVTVTDLATGQRSSGRSVTINKGAISHVLPLAGASVGAGKAPARAGDIGSAPTAQMPAAGRSGAPTVPPQPPLRGGPTAPFGDAGEDDVSDLILDDDGVDDIELD